MAQTGYTPILIYSSSTVSQAPAAGNLTNSTLGSELAINITDGKLFYKDNANAVQVIAWKVTPTTAGGTGLTSYTQGDLLYYDSGTTLAKLAKSTTATRYLSNTGANNNPAWAQIDLTNGVTGTLPVGNGGTGTSTAFTAGSVVFAGAAGVFSQDNANLFWDDTNNWLGIGTAAPGARLTISNNTALPSAGVITGTNLWVVGTNATNNTVLLDAFGSNSLLAFRRASGTAASPTAVTSGSSLANIGARGYGTTGYSSGNRASINMSAAETWTDTAQGTRIAFNTTAIGSTTLSERMSIENTGDVNINTGNLVLSTAGKGIDFSAGGIANGVAYLDGSKLLASFSSNFKFDGTTLDLGSVGSNGRLTIKAPSTQRAVLCYNSAGTAYFYTDNDNAVSTGANAADAVLFINKITSNNRSINAAGTLNASGADYAEYMTKAGNFVLAKGDVCGVDASGKLTNVFANAISFVVKSTDPSFVGGDIWGANLEGDELEAARQQVDRVAFAGQVPVNITGAAPGQYIVPIDDGGAIKPCAVDEANMTLAMYMKAVGKVIAIEPDGRAKIIVKTA